MLTVEGIWMENLRSKYNSSKKCVDIPIKSNGT